MGIKFNLGTLPTGIEALDAYARIHKMIVKYDDRCVEICSWIYLDQDLRISGKEPLFEHIEVISGGKYDLYFPTTSDLISSDRVRGYNALMECDFFSGAIAC